MRRRIRWRAFAIAGLTTTILGALLAPPARAAAGVVALPLPSYRDMQVDDSHRRVFVAGGDEILAVDDGGRILRTITGQVGVSGLTLSADGSRLYAGLRGAGAISVIDTKKLREVARYPTGALCPGDVVLAVGKLWFSAACTDNTSSGSMAALDLATGEVVTYATFLPAVWGVPLLAVSVREGWPTTLVLAARDLSGSQLRTYDITFGAPDPMCWNPGGCQAPLSGIVQDIAVTRDGANLVVASGAQYHSVIPVIGLVTVDTYPTGPSPTAVAVGEGDLLALGSEGPAGSEPDVFGYAWGAESPLWTVDFGLRPTAYNDVASRGLAWTAGNNRLYAVVTDRDGSLPVLHILAPPA